MSKYRKEIKYDLMQNDFVFLNENLKILLKKDENCIGEDYTISSLYFDDYKKTSYNQVKDGVSERWKYRIRFYNYDDSYINLEKKYKINGLTNKNSVRINRKIFDSILNGTVKINENNPSLLNEFILKINNDLLKPVILIEYDRIPYIYKVGNVRITLDYNIRYTNNFKNVFLSNKRVYYLKNKILEIKYDEIFPEFIKYKLRLNNLERVSFSKFNNCINCLYRRF